MKHNQQQLTKQCSVRPSATHDYCFHYHYYYFIISLAATSITRCQLKDQPENRMHNFNQPFLSIQGKSSPRVQSSTLTFNPPHRRPSGSRPLTLRFLSSEGKPQRMSSWIERLLNQPENHFRWQSHVSISDWMSLIKIGNQNMSILLMMMMIVMILMTVRIILIRQTFEAVDNNKQYNKT